MSTSPTQMKAFFEKQSTSLPDYKGERFFSMRSNLQHTFILLHVQKTIFRNLHSILIKKCEKVPVKRNILQSQTLDHKIVSLKKKAAFYNIRCYGIITRDLLTEASFRMSRAITKAGFMQHIRQKTPLYVQKIFRAVRGLYRHFRTNVRYRQG